jgi:hypothetical protein
MTAYDDFLPYVLQDVPGCPEIAAVHAIRNTVIDFCEKSLVVQVDLDPVSLVANQADYDLEPPTNRLVTKVIHLFYKNKELAPFGQDAVPSATFYNPSATDADGKTNPRGWSQKDTTTFTVWPVPHESKTNAITIRAALKPTRKSTSCDDILFEDYAEYIGAGAKARLMVTPNKSYTNLQLVQTQNQLYMQGVNMARQRVSRGHTRANLRIKMVPI